MAMPAQSARPASPSQVSVPLSDARDVGAKSVRFSAAQFTRESVTVILFGATDKSWAKLRAAVQQAVFDGYPVKMVFIGPVSEPRGIEIYAKGHHVTRRIDPETISAVDITKLLRDVTQEYYRR